MRTIPTDQFATPRILYVTNNAHLRSTSASLNAVIGRFCPSSIDPVLLFRDPGPWQQSLEDRGIACHFDPLRLPEKRTPFRSALAIRRLVRMVRDERIDAIHCNEHDSYPLMRWVARWAGVPILVHVRFKITPEFGAWAFGGSWTPTALQFTSHALLDACRDALPASIAQDRLHVVMNGLDIDQLHQRGTDSDAQRLRATWGVAPGTTVIGTASSLRSHKRLEDFVMLIARLRTAGQPVFGVIAGGPPFADEAYVSTIRQLISEQNLESHCQLVGNLDPITPLMKAIDLFVSTSQWETFGMSVCEAMACGKPAMAFDAGGLAEVVHDPWCIVPDRNLDEMTTRVARLVADLPFRHSMGQAARQFVGQHFDAPAMARRQAAVYESIGWLSRRSTPAWPLPRTA